MTGRDSSQWPVGSILGYGTFGAGSPAGRRYHRRTAVALVVFVVWMILGGRFPGTLFRTLVPMAPGALFIYIVYEFRLYLAGLDELARRMQMEALAWTYLTGLAVAMLVGGILLNGGSCVNPMWFIVLEPVRAWFLYVASRRY